MNKYILTSLLTRGLQPYILIDYALTYLFPQPATFFHKVGHSWIAFRLRERI